MLIKHILWVICHIIRFFELRTVKSLKAKPKKSTTSTIFPTPKAHNKNQAQKNRQNSTILASENNRVAGQIWRACSRFERQARNAGPLLPFRTWERVSRGCFPSPAGSALRASPPVCSLSLSPSQFLILEDGDREHTAYQLPCIYHLQSKSSQLPLLPPLRCKCELALLLHIITLNS